MPKVTTEELSQEIRRIEKKHKRITPQIIVDEAKEKSSLLHSMFPWDDAYAANQHRLDIARALLRRVCYISHPTPDRTVTAVAYIHEPGVPHQSYVHTNSLDVEQSWRALMERFTLIEGILRRSLDLADALGLRNELDIMIEEFLEARRTMASKKPPSKDKGGKKKKPEDHPHA